MSEKPVMGGINFGLLVPGGQIVCGPVTGPIMVPKDLNSLVAATVKDTDLAQFDSLVFCDTPEVVVEKRALQALVAAVRAARAEVQRLGAEVQTQEARIIEEGERRATAEANTEKALEQAATLVDEEPVRFEAGTMSALHQRRDLAERIRCLKVPEYAKAEGA